jgi:hypothetical protein
MARAITRKNKKQTVAKRNVLKRKVMKRKINKRSVVKRSKKSPVKALNRLVSALNRRDKCEAAADKQAQAAIKSGNLKKIIQARRKESNCQKIVEKALKARS